MNRSVLICFVLAAFSAAGVSTGCGDDDNNGTPSGKGESCTRTADCKGGLLCIAATCVAGPGASNPDAGEPNQPSGTGGSSGSGGGGNAGTGTAPVALGGEGESCTRRADCASGLACVLQTCTASGMSPGGDTDGGATTTPLPTLGQRGESCQSVRDCAEGLTCIPRPNVSGGICDLEKYGLTPTGKTCNGECKAAADCCELPTSVVIADPVAATFTSVSSCADIVDLLDGDPTVCDAATPAPAKDPACFYYKTYCECAANTWACTDSRCVYAAKCAKDGNVFKGCPTRTRTGVATNASTCDTMTDKCKGAATGCETADDCLGLTVSDDQSDTCTADECACVQTRCYRKCGEDLDCPAQYLCDTKQKVCTPAPECSDDARCAATARDVRAVCQKNKCVIPCETDHDCSPSGSVGDRTFTAQVCNKGVCEALGCASDDECQTQGGVREFCVAPSTTTQAAVKSAVTD